MYWPRLGTDGSKTRRAAQNLIISKSDGSVISTCKKNHICRASTVAKKGSLTGQNTALWRRNDCGAGFWNATWNQQGSAWFVLLTQSHVCSAKLRTEIAAVAKAVLLLIWLIWPCFEILRRRFSGVHHHRNGTATGCHLAGMILGTVFIRADFVVFLRNQKYLTLYP